MPIVQRSKCMKIDQVIDLILDENMSSESDSNDENVPINRNQTKQPVTQQANKQQSTSIHQQTVTTTDDEDDVPLSKLVAKKRVVLKVLKNSNATNRMPLSNKPLNVGDTPKLVKQQESSSSDEEDNIPLGILLAKKSPICNKSAMKTPTRRVRKLNTLLKGIYDIWSECESDEDDQLNTKQPISDSTSNEIHSPVLSFDKSISKYILSLKNSKRKSFF